MVKMYRSWGKCTDHGVNVQIMVKMYRSWGKRIDHGVNARQREYVQRFPSTELIPNCELLAILVKKWIGMKNVDIWNNPKIDHDRKEKCSEGKINPN
jgi:hypothetical protein